MMAIDEVNSRKPTIFENILLFLGLIAVGVSYYFVYGVILRYGMYSYQSTVSLLLWILIVVVIILTAVNENSKEELKIIIRQQHEEMKLLRSDFRRKK